MVLGPTKMVNLKMVADNISPAKFARICSKLNEFVRADANGKRTDFILTDYEVKASYVEYILRQLLSGDINQVRNKCDDDM